MRQLRSDFRFSEHAQHRFVERSFSDECVDAIWEYGREYHAGSGCIALFLGKKEVAAACRRGLRIDQWMNKALIIALDGVVVTLMNVFNIPRHWKGA